MKITKSPDGKWQVLGADEEVLETCETNAQAWRALDRLANEPTNRAENTVDWLFSNSLKAL
ncbi:hypothetical protein [Methylocella sp.]|jgi:hypothetical protein|uniref:hypothetical protein n=1 Tax=Methylocella sp. TaxID=1978226 RepID=UPI003C258CD3